LILIPRDSSCLLTINVVVPPSHGVDHTQHKVYKRVAAMAAAIAAAASMGVE
jgi:hypothetical protein